MQSRTIRAVATGLLAATLLAACGGGGGDETPSSPAGTWWGTTTSNRDLTAVALADGSYFLMYSAVGDPNTVGGAVQGTGAALGASFTSTDALEFSAELPGARPGSLSASLDPETSFSGTFTPTSGPVLTFQAKAPAGGFFPGGRLALAGSYVGTAGFPLGIRPATFEVTAAGAVSSSINGCAISGTATPRTDNDAYDLTIVFGGAPCATPVQGMSFVGVAYRRPDNGRMYAVARNAASRFSVIFSGTRS